MSAMSLLVTDIAPRVLGPTQECQRARSGVQRVLYPEVEAGKVAHVYDSVSLVAIKQLLHMQTCRWRLL